MFDFEVEGLLIKGFKDMFYKLWTILNVNYFSPHLNDIVNEFEDYKPSLRKLNKVS